jgi:hypothetical protein
MDTQNELTIKISDTEIFFNCKNYDKDFIVELGKVILNVLPGNRPLRPQDVLNAMRNFLNSGDNGNMDKTGPEIIDGDKLRDIANTDEKSQNDKELKPAITKTAKPAKRAYTDLSKLTPEEKKEHKRKLEAERHKKYNNNFKILGTRRNPVKFKDKREEIIFDIKSGLGLAECQERYGMSKNTYARYKKIALESQSNPKKPNRLNRSKNMGSGERPMTPEERAEFLNNH